MNAPDLLALSLGLSVATAGMAWIGGRLVEVRTADPRLRDRMWAAALALPALPPLAVGLLLLTPAPVREIAVATPLAAAPTLLEASALSATAPMAPAFDPDLIAPVILAAAAIAAIWRLGRLGLGAWRLGRLLGGLGEADAGTVAMVHEVAGRLSLRPPRVGVSPGATEPLLAGFTTPRLILPAGLATAGDRAVARAMIAHELVHLKRNDHRIIWLEEALLALLAANPLMPALRARRAAAREEACDAQALDGAGAETRRAYAQSLIEALRSRAGPQALPALTFTGAGRKSAMHRLKAVMTPAAPAGRRTRLISAGAALAVAAAAGAGSLAVAAEREPVMRLQTASPETPVPASGNPRVIDMGADARVLLNGEPLPEGLPMWAVAPDRIDVRTPPAGSGEMNLILSYTGQTPVSVDGRRLPKGFPARGVNPDAVAQMEIVGDHVMFTLKPEAEVRRARRTQAVPDTGAHAATAAALGSLTPEQQARFRNPTGQQYQDLCASTDPADDGFCAGVIFSQFPSGGGSRGDICLPADLEQGDEAARRAALGTLVERTKAEIARATIRPGDRPAEVARAALSRAYSCEAAAFRAEAARMARDFVPLTVSVDIEGRPLSVEGDETLRVVLTDETGAVMNTHGTINGGGGRRSRPLGPLGPLGMALHVDDFPQAWEGARAYTLTGEIRGPDRVLRYVAEPVTLRLAPGARRADLRPTLSFRPAA